MLPHNSGALSFQVFHLFFLWQQYDFIKKRKRKKDIKGRQQEVHQKKEKKKVQYFSLYKYLSNDRKQKYSL